MLENDVMWYWFTAAVALGILECLVDGFVILGFGVACFVFGLLTNLPMIYQGLSAAHFLVLTAVIVAAFYGFGNRLFWGDRRSGPVTPIGLTARDRILGEVAMLRQPIINGEGLVEAKGTTWKCTGADLPAGTRVVVADLQGNTLLVKRLEES
ncbi:MAG: NfeD family protein [Rhodospirillaceae bacterium]